VPKHEKSAIYRETATGHAICKRFRVDKGAMIRKSEGFFLIDLIFVCGIIGVLSAAALPRLLKAKQAASAASAIGSLRTVSSSELTYALSCGGGFYAPTFPILGTPPVGATDGFISPDMSGAVSFVKSDYLMQLDGAPYAGAPASCNGVAPGQAARGYAAAADPMEPANLRYFAINSDSIIYEDNASLWTTMPEIGAPPSGIPLKHW
jgi:type II secretory pathway pseudopilin PulG